MYRRLKQFFIVVGIGYFSLHCVSAQLANFALAVFLVLLIPFFILRYIYLNNFYKYSINIVSKQFVANKNTIRNEHCTVMYSPDEKIIVMDNAPDRTHAKRMFTLTKNKLNINKAWNRVCRIFDSFVSLDSLAAFYSYDTKVDIITLEAKVPPRPERKRVSQDKVYEEPKFVELDNIQADPYAKGTNLPNDKGASYVNIDNIQEQKPFVPAQEKEIEYSGMGELMNNSPNKINVNTATSSELSILPGINIVMAKKIVEYRDKNGYFNSVEDFFSAANVKEHFVEKIKPLITVEIPQENHDEDDTYEGRIIDF